MINNNFQILNLIVNEMKKKTRIIELISFN